jgi:hypothetical protein
LPAPAVNLLTDGDLLLASCQSSGLVLLDVSSPASPAVLSTVDVGTGAAAQAAVSGSLVALSAGTAGLLLVDISVPTAPVQVGSWSKSYGFVSGAAFSSPTVVWVGQSTDGITSVDVSTPSAPVELGKLSYEIATGNLLADGDYLYAALGSTGLAVTDISDPAKPAKSGSLPFTRALRIVKEGSSLLLADGVAGMAEVDIADPENPFVKAYFETPGQIVSAIFLPDGSRLAAAGEGGLWAVVPSSCEGPTLRLPCDGAQVSSFVPPLFTWIPKTGAKYKVEISKKSTFPKENLFVGKSAAELLKVPSFMPSGGWRKLQKWGRGGATLYWRVVTIEGSSKTVSETRTLTLW